MTQIIVVDLDGTLCNSAHREHLARAGQWDEFHSLLGDDQPWPDVKALMEIVYHVGNIDIIGLTGRNERYRNATTDWLGEHDIFIDDVLMRPNDNYESDHELKPRMLAEALAAMGSEQKDVLFILEDRDKVVEAWRNLGYSCWQVRPGGY